MPAVLTDPPPALWILLVIFALVSVGLWLRSRKRGMGIAAVIAVLLLVLLFLCRFAGESPRQEATRRMKAIVAAIDARKPDDMLPHIAEDFDYHGRKQDIKASGLWGLLDQENARVSAKFLDGVDPPPPEGTVVIDLNAWGTARGQDHGPLFIRATFKKDAKGEWKVTTMWATLDQIRKANGTEFFIPYLGK
jgi:hypothetical protein